MIIFELKVLHNVLDLENSAKNNIKVLTRYLGSLDVCTGI